MRYDADRVLARIDRRGRFECWPISGWTKDGYGTYMENGHERRVTHLVLEIDGRPLGPGQQALHHCDNPPCCNAKHLYRGSPANNVRDMQERKRDRAASGQGHGMAKISDVDTELIRTLYANGTLQKDLALRFGVSQPAISMIVNDRRRRK